MSMEDRAGYTHHNKLARQITKKVRRQPGPSHPTTRKWWDEWIAEGHDRSCTFVEYKGRKMKKYWKEYHKKKEENK